MAVPVLFAIDEDELALGAVERELVDRYSRGYRVVCVPSPEKAMAELLALREAGEDVWHWSSPPSRSRGRPGASCWARCATSTRTPSAGC